MAEDPDAPYVFKEKPAAKSSTSILVHGPGGSALNVACPTCGCRRPPKPGCQCRCHQTWNE